MLIIRVPMVRVSCGITPNITSTMTPTASIMVRRRLTGLASFLLFFFPALLFPKISFSRKLIGTLMTKAIAPPSAKGNRITHIVFSTSITTSNFHNAAASSAVNMISSRIFFTDSLLKSIIFLHFFLISYESTSATE